MHDVIETIPRPRYFLRDEDGVDREVSEAEFIQAERAEGFYPEKGEGVATCGFEGRVTGTIIYEGVESWHSNVPLVWT